jgi:Na+-translocating ferredoxin:NAD+ oxidoreductase RnfD subunit
VITAVFRLLGGSAEGVSYAIIFGNLLVPLIERVTRPTAFGKGGKRA